MRSLRSRVISRSARNFQDALNIYEQFLHLPSSPYFREACLWSAFCKASAEPPQFGAAQLFLNQFLATYKADGGTPPRDDSIYSLWRLIEALLAFKDPQQTLENAMDKVSEAVVFPDRIQLGPRNPSPLCTVL